MGTDRYASTPKLIIDEVQKPFLDLDDALVEYRDYDDDGTGYTSSDFGESSSVDLGGTGAAPDPGIPSPPPPPPSGPPSGGSPPPLLDIPIFVPGSLVQTPRVTADGSTVIDVSFQVSDVVGATKYEVRVTTG